ncbi:MAG TPA: ester cyclase [Acidimicrobiia bacterium]|nr:ester cyclase [Acidimicrobiia bacterium]
MLRANAVGAAYARRGRDEQAECNARAHAAYAAATATRPGASPELPVPSALLVRGLQAGATGDSSVLAELYADDVKGWSPMMAVESAAELAIELEDRDDAFSDVELAFAPLDVGGDQACVEWTITATHSGPLVFDDDLRIEPTGVRVTVHGVTVAELDGDRIRSFRQYWDEAELLAQLGLLPDCD